MIENTRESHLEQIDRWASFVRENPKQWKKSHSKFINAIFDKHQQFKHRLLKTPRGKEKLAELYGITNKEGYEWMKE